MVYLAPVRLVGGAHFERIHAVQHIQLGQRDALDAADLDGLTHHHRVKPAATPPPARDGAKFVAALAQALPHRIVQLGGKRAGTDARGIGLGDAQHITDRARTDAAARRRLSRHGVGRSDVRVRAVIDIEHGALRTLKKNSFAGPSFAFEAAPDGA